MPRFYFHVHDGPPVIDRIGRDLPDIPAARLAALAYAGTLIGARDADAWATRDWSLVVYDETGAEVLRFDIKRTPGTQ